MKNSNNLFVVHEIEENFRSCGESMTDSPQEERPPMWDRQKENN